MSEHLQLQFLR